MDGGPLGNGSGQGSRQPAQYAPDILHAIPRSESRTVLGLLGTLPFSGADLWTGYELSWLDPNGKPQVGVLRVRVPCETPALIESKSLKLYLNAMNQEPFATPTAVARVIGEDLSRVAGAEVAVSVLPLTTVAEQGLVALTGESIDALEVEMGTYEVASELLMTAEDRVDETLRSDLVRSVCPVTGQPDWASVMVRYRGPRIDAASLLRYLVSYRQHADFHETCVERMFRDIQDRCDTEALTVWALYTRRGGLDISPFRSDFEPVPEALRLARM
jgi:7-cyano-7-deazaguanine reductase